MTLHYIIIRPTTHIIHICSNHIIHISIPVIKGIKAGKYDNIRVFYGPMNFDYGTNRTDIW